MKILTRTAAAVLAAVTAAAVWAVPAAAAASVQGISSTSCIADNANILSRDTETYITNISVALQENCSGAQIGVYTTDYVGNNTMEGYAYEVFQAWGLGSADQDNGMVLLMATGDDNYWATPGEGLESAFSGNVLSDLLYDNLEASWAKQDYDTGARKTVLAMAERHLRCIWRQPGYGRDRIRPGRFFRQDCGKHPEPQQWRGGAYLDFADDYYCSDRDCDPENAARTPRAAGSHLHRRPPRAERILFRRTGLPAAPSPASSPAAPSGRWIWWARPRC